MLFDLNTLGKFVAGGSFPPDASPDFRPFNVGEDDVHSILKFLLEMAPRESLKINMFGYDDESLNAIVMAWATDPAPLVQITLDKSQAGGVHEKKLLAADQAQSLAAFGTHFAIGQSATHSISHTKGGVINGIVAWEGSVNWSADGEGTFVLGQTAPGGPGYKAQNNTLTVYTNPYAIRKFSNRLDWEHAVAVNQAHALPEGSRQRALPIAA